MNLCYRQADQYPHSCPLHQFLHLRIIYNGAHRYTTFPHLRPMSNLSPRRSIQSVVELTLMIVLIAIVALSILLILGDDVRVFVNDVLSGWFPE